MVSHEIDKKDFFDYGYTIHEPNLDTRKTKNKDLIYWREVSTFKMDEISTGILEVMPRQTPISKLERHVNTFELVSVLSGGGFIVFAKPEGDPNKTLKAFKVKQGDSFLMRPGTWHSLILPQNNQISKLLILFKKNTEDLDIEFKMLKKPIAEIT